MLLGVVVVPLDVGGVTERAVCILSAAKDNFFHGVGEK